MKFILKNTFTKLNVIGKTSNGYYKVSNENGITTYPPSCIEKYELNLRGYPVIIDYDFKIVKVNGITESFASLSKIKTDREYEIFDLHRVKGKELRKIISKICITQKKTY